MKNILRLMALGLFLSLSVGNLTACEDAKKEAETEGTEKLNALKKKLDAQYESAMAEIDAEEVQARKDLEPEIEKLAKQIVDKVMA